MRQPMPQRRTKVDTKQLALKLLRESPTYLEDARQGAHVGNSVVGSLLNIQHQIPRQVAEQAVLEAIADIDAKASTDGETFTIQRDGQPPLKFRGELVAEEESRERQGPRQNRWHEIALYRTVKGKWVAAVVFRTCWQGEEDSRMAYVCESDAALCDSLQHEYDATRGWIGHPIGSHDAERKNAILRDTITDGYNRAVSRVLTEAGIVEEIE
jgi:hypothetical protein